ncbi:MAG: PQQ-binding-like beta-propeller repeat protein [Deltaproteobacteria bacterium]|nr:PQQ-binding-like beta-propeller repeat protein [Deltaproteobacteria bacterium]
MLAARSLSLLLLLLPAAAGADSTAMKAHKRDVAAVAVAGDVVASGGDDGTVVVWNGTAPGPTRESDDGAVKAVAVAPDGKTVAIGTMYGQLSLWDAGAKKDLFTAKGHGGRINGIAFFPDGKTFATASVDQSVKVFDTGGKELVKLEGKYNVFAVAVSADGKLLLSCNSNGEVTSWNVKTKKPAAAYAPGKGECHALALTGDGKALAVGYGDGTVVVVEPGSGKELRRAKVSDSINALAFSGDGKTIAAATQADELALIDDAQNVKTLKGHARPLTGVAFKRDGAIVTGSMDMTVRVWK